MDCNYHLLLWKSAMGIDLETISCHGVIQKTRNRILNAGFRRALWSTAEVQPTPPENYWLSRQECIHIALDA